jgi:hypothetical protein
MPAAMTMPVAHSADAARPAADVVAPRGSMSDVVSTVHATGTTGHDSACVFTAPPRGLDGLIALLLLAAISVGLSAPRPIGAGLRRSTSHRDPPLSGTGLLATLCVSRT